MFTPVRCLMMPKLAPMGRQVAGGRAAELQRHQPLMATYDSRFGAAVQQKRPRERGRPSAITLV